MFKKLMIASLAVGALALQAPAALADHATYDCGFNAVAQEDVTGGQNTYTGAAYGYIASPTPGENVTIRCFLTVNGTEVASTDTGAGVQFATTQGDVSFTAADDETVLLCAEWTAGDEGDTECFESTNTQIPPQAVIDLIEELEIGTIDPLLCPVLKTVGLTGLANIPGVLLIDGQGDVYLLGELFWDCPPYAPLG